MMDSKECKKEKGLFHQLFHQMRQALSNQRGYVSLVEAAATVAVGLTLAAAVGPTIINVGDDAKITRAKQEVVAIQQAISKFVSDTTEFPIRKTAAIPNSIPATAAEARSLFPVTAVDCLRSGNNSTADPGGTSSFSFTALCPSLAESSFGTFLNSHLVHDAVASVSLLYRTGGDRDLGQLPRNWNGPYIKEILQDPWGRNYVIYTKGMLRATDGPTGAQFYAWALSAGPNGQLETTQFSSSAQGDDVGTLVATVNVPDPNFKSATQ